MKIITMMRLRMVKDTALVTMLLALGLGCATAQPASDPLPSWNDGAAKQAIVQFVAKTTRQGKGALFLSWRIRPSLKQLAVP